MKLRESSFVKSILVIPLIQIGILFIWFINMELVRIKYFITCYVYDSLSIVKANLFFNLVTTLYNFNHLKPIVNNQRPKLKSNLIRNMILYLSIMFKRDHSLTIFKYLCILAQSNKLLLANKQKEQCNKIRYQQLLRDSHTHTKKTLRIREVLMQVIVIKNAEMYFNENNNTQAPIYKKE